MSEKLNCKVMTTEKDYMRLNNNNKIIYIKSELKIIEFNTLCWTETSQVFSKIFLPIFLCPSWLRLLLEMPKDVE